MPIATWWNTVRYTLLSKFYNRILSPLELGRKRSIELVDIQPNETVLLLGAGTGLDLNYLPSHAKYTAVDITPSMLSQCQQKADQLQFSMECIVMDGQQLQFADETFDVVLLHLILAVIPDPIQCIKEVQRVLKPNGRVIIFDKFIPDESNASLFRKFVNLSTRFWFSNINHKLGSILQNVNQLQVISKEPAPSQFSLVHKMHFQIVKLCKI